MRFVYLPFAFLVAFICPSGTARSLIHVPPAGQVYLGAYVGLPWYDPNVKSAYNSLESKLGRKLDIDRIYNIFNERFPFEYHKWTASQGRIPFISLQPITVTNGIRTRIPWGDIAAGKWDGYLGAVGNDLKAWGAKIFFCFHHEPDLDATCPGDTLHGCDLKRWHGTSSQYKAAYAHIRSLFDGMGLNTMNWNSNLGAATRYYPGPGVVDWIALDVYNFIATPNDFKNWADLGPMMNGWYRWASTTNLPLMLAEWGCKEYRPNPADPKTWNNAAKPNWFLRALGSVISDYPNIKAYVYFHKNQDPNDWRVDSTDGSFSAFHKLARDPAFNWWKSGSGPSNPDGPNFRTLYKFSFQPAHVPTPAGYLADTGGVFASRHGVSYGWNADASSTARVRSSPASPSVVYDTLLHMQIGRRNYEWEVALPNGVYTVKIIAGDPSYYPGCYAISLEGTLALRGCTSSASRWITWTGTVNVRDGRLTVSNTPGISSGNKINAIEISQAAGVVVQSSIAGARKRQASGEPELISGAEFLGLVADYTGQPIERFSLVNETYDPESGGQTFQYVIFDGPEFAEFIPARSIAVNLTLDTVDWIVAGHPVAHSELLDTILTPETATIDSPEEPLLSEPVSYLLIASISAVALLILALASVIVYQALRIRKLKAKFAETSPRDNKERKDESGRSEATTSVPSVTSQNSQADLLGRTVALASEKDARVLVPASVSEDSLDPESGTPCPLAIRTSTFNYMFQRKPSGYHGSPASALSRALAKLLSKSDTVSDTPTTRRL